MIEELLNANVFDPLVSALLEEMPKLSSFKREKQLRLNPCEPPRLNCKAAVNVM